MRKFLLLTLLAFLPMIGMNAQCVMSADDVNINSGETAEIKLNLSVDGNYYKDTKCEILLPEGFSFATKTVNDVTTYDISGNPTIDLSSYGMGIIQGRQVGMSVESNYLGDNLYRVVTVSISKNNYINNRTDLYFIKGTIQADETVVSGTYPVSVKNIEITSNELINGEYVSKDFTIADFTFNIVYTASPKSYDLTMASFSEMATMYLDFPVDIPNGVLGVYYVSGVEGNTLTMYEIENKIPANTPVIVMANPGTTHTFTEATGTVATITDNLLKGVLEETSVSSLGGTIYTLGRGKNSSLLGFHKYTGTTLGANKAYLTRDNSNVNSFNLVFTDGSTSIHSLQADGDKDVYDLQGRKVEKVTRGVYIIDGVKTVVK